MVLVETYHLPATALIPNSHYPLLYYPSFFPVSTASKAATVQSLLAKNGWQAQWIYRYGPTQRSHYHSRTHECMAVLSGSATIRFGVADTTEDEPEHTHSQGKEDGGIEIQAQAGDVFVLPAGVAHKTCDPVPKAEFALLTKGHGHGIEAEDVGAHLQSVELSGFTMIGAYPKDSEWDFSFGGEDKDREDQIWGVPKPASDPVLGQAHEGLCGQWKAASPTL